MVVLDTCAVIDLGRSAPAGHLCRKSVAAFRAQGDSFATTRFTLAELYVGATLARDPAQETRRIAAAAAWLPILEFDDPSARVYGRIGASLRQAERPIGDFDALIASVTIANGAVLLTRNARHFEGIIGLTIETY